MTHATSALDDGWDDDAAITREIERPVLTAVRPESARLIVVAGADTGRRFTLGERAVIGRGAGVAVPLRDPLASRRHAQITRGADGTLVLEDLDSKNGTQINGRETRRAALRFGDRIVVGATTLSFTCRYGTEDQLTEREQLETLGRLSAELVHDMNNLLAVSLVCAELIRELLVDPAQLPETRAFALESIDGIIQSSNHGRELTLNLLTLARRQPVETEELDLSDVVRESVQLAARMFHRHIEVARDIDEGTRVVGNRAELRRVVMNLLLNARDAVPDGGRVEVRLKSHRDDEVHLEVRDSGVGMDEETRARIFEPFFTTKGPGRGSGIGLGTVAQVVAAHGGRIACESAPGLGTAMSIVLPRAAKGATPPTELPPARAPRAALR